MALLINVRPVACTLRRAQASPQKGSGGYKALSFAASTRSRHQFPPRGRGIMCSLLLVRAPQSLIFMISHSVYQFQDSISRSCMVSNRACGSKKEFVVSAEFRALDLCYLSCIYCGTRDAFMPAINIQRIFVVEFLGLSGQTPPLDTAMSYRNTSY